MRKSDAGHTTSCWEASEKLIDRRSGLANKTEEYDVCIVGAGIAGLTTAYLLSKAKKKVIVVDDGLIGGGETSRTTAHLSNAIDDRIYRIEEWHGKENAKLAVESHTKAINKIEDIVNSEKIDCDFTRLDGYLVDSPEGTDDLEKEFEATQRCGPAGVEWVDNLHLEGFDSGKCLRFPHQGQFHVLKYLAGLVRAIESYGGTLVSHKRVVGWEGGANPKITTEDDVIASANSLVLATNYPLMSKMFAKLPAYRTYAIAAELPKKRLEKILIWDTEDPYHYVRTQEDSGHDLLIVGGEDHRTGQENDGETRFANLKRWTEERFPNAGGIKYEWSGQFLETHDGLAFLGRFSDSEPNVYLITGDSGMGMTHGTVGAMIASDQILGRENVWANVYDPSRLTTQSLKEAVPEIIDSTVPYTDWVTPGDISSEADLKKGEGAVMRDGVSRIAVYRDENGEVHRLNAKCTHLGCVVRFNSLEKTWDCPCHGSRFALDGNPINSPAITPLSKAEN
ncbi:MAG TPA: FAD-dependent oxidoreductase [Pyrinomonadaceae bacterium]|nr:FAD-dependent oxidoreductase [Pyrinomonadaceae bacterium]